MLPETDTKRTLEEAGHQARCPRRRQAAARLCSFADATEPPGPQTADAGPEERDGPLGPSRAIVDFPTPRRRPEPADQPARVSCLEGARDGDQVRRYVRPSGGGAGPEEEDKGEGHGTPEEGGGGHLRVNPTCPESRRSPLKSNELLNGSFNSISGKISGGGPSNSPPLRCDGARR